jgi:hypothetical protein
MCAPVAVLNESFLSDAFAGREGQTPPFKGRAHATPALCKNHSIAAPNGEMRKWEDKGTEHKCLTTGYACNCNAKEIRILFGLSCLSPSHSVALSWYHTVTDFTTFGLPPFFKLDFKNQFYITSNFVSILLPAPKALFMYLTQ